MAPETENVGPGEIEYVSVDMRCRPRRPLILVDSSQGWPVVFEAIRFASCLWGGWYSAIAPVDPTLLESMLPILRVFDPDDVFGVGSIDVSSKANELLGSYLNPFRQLDEMVTCNVWGGRVEYGYCDIRKSTRQLDLATVVSLEVKCEGALAAWIYSHSGLLPARDEFSRDDDEPTLVPFPSVLTADELARDTSRVAEFAKRPWGTSSGGAYPFDVGLKKLAWQAMRGASPSPFNPAIVMGETISDFCLYYTLARLRPHVFWLPWRDVGRPLASEGGTQGNLRALYTVWAANELHYPASPRRRATEAHLVSMSLDASSLPSLLADVLQSAPPPMRRSLTPRTCQPGDTRTLVPRPGRVWEEGYRPSQYVPVRRGEMQTALHTPVLRFEQSPLAGQHAWVIGCHFGHCSCTPRKGCLVEATEPHTDVTPARSGRGSIAYPSFPGFLDVGGPVEDAVHYPMLMLPTGLEMAKGILGGIGLRAGLSDAGEYQRDFIEAFGGLKQAAEVIRNPFAWGLLQLFADRESQLRVCDRGWIHKENEPRYLDMRAVSNVLTPLLLNSLDKSSYLGLLKQWLQLAVLERGFVLKCHRCRFADWYSISDLTQTFKCGRCASVDHYEPAPNVYWRLNESVCQAVANNMHLHILALDTMARFSRGRFAYSSAIELPRHHEPPVPGDIDILAVVEGELWIGEAKKRGGIQQKELARLKNLARTLRPDVLVLATDAESWDDGQVGDNFRPLATELIAIGTQLITMSRHDLYNPASFYSRMRGGRFLPDGVPTH